MFALFLGVCVCMDILFINNIATDFRLVKVCIGRIRNIMLMGLYDQNRLKSVILHLHVGARIYIAGLHHYILLYIHYCVNTRPQ